MKIKQLFNYLAGCGSSAILGTTAFYLLGSHPLIAAFCASASCLSYIWGYRALTHPIKTSKMPSMLKL